MKGQRLYDSIVLLMGEHFCSNNHQLLEVICGKVGGATTVNGVLLYNLVRESYVSGFNGCDLSTLDVAEHPVVLVRNSVTGTLSDAVEDVIVEAFNYGLSIRKRDIA
ncbi:hypothetical protein HY483_03075 [Candidatus Woesearchaeota archaeon]|nr:hypothetical protein [Candidatus Woesearchaeota archaeon]